MKHLPVMLALLTAAPASALPPAAFAQASGPLHVEHEADYIRAIVRYVRNSRGWPDNAYTVVLYGKDGDDLIFSIDYGRGDNATHFVGNEGDSFKVLFNPKTGKVEHEMYFG